MNIVNRVLWTSTAGALALISIGLGYLYISTSQRLSASDHAQEEASKQNQAIVANLEKSLSEKDGVIFTLQSETEALRSELATTTEEAARIKEAQEAEHEAIGKFVIDVQKVQNTDPELLKKYSKNYFLNENYKPSSLSTIPAQWQTSKRTPIEYLAPAIPFIVKMFDAAQNDGIGLRVVSGFRSFEDQKDLKSVYKATFGTGANKFSADQGYSEHQLGTAVDLSTKELDTSYTNITSAPAYKWLQDNGYKYGYILSYPKGNAYYMYEPWHWRFVGIKLATELHNRGINFYEMDQREIDRYLGDLFDPQ